MVNYTSDGAGVNLASSNASHPPQNCRIYYSQITLKPEKHVEYIKNNKAKKVVYRSFITNIVSNIAGIIKYWYYITGIIKYCW